MLRSELLQGVGQGQSREQQPGQTRSHGSEGLGHISDIVLVLKPYAAKYRGQNVNVSAYGNVIGMSPAKEITFENGRQDWVSLDDPEFIATDEDYVPRLTQQTAQLFGGFTGRETR